MEEKQMAKKKTNFKKVDSAKKERRKELVNDTSMSGKYPELAISQKSLEFEDKEESGRKIKPLCQKLEEIEILLSKHVLLEINRRSTKRKRTRQQKYSISEGEGSAYKEIKSDYSENSFNCNQIKSTNNFTNKEGQDQSSCSRSSDADVSLCIDSTFEIEIDDSSRDDSDQDSITNPNNNSIFRSGTVENLDMAIKSNKDKGLKRDEVYSYYENSGDMDSNVSQDDEESEYANNYLDLDQKEILEIRASKLAMAIQGFKSNARKYDNLEDKEHPISINSKTQCDPGSVMHRGKRYHKRRCYKLKMYNNTAPTVGILNFLPEKDQRKLVRCVLIVPFEDTILGMEDADVHYEANFKPSSHVQVYNHVKDLPITDLKGESDEIQDIPSLIYEPQVAGTNSWQKFGYFYDKKVKRYGKRKDMRMLDIFAGAGGMCQGYLNAGFQIVMAVDKDTSAIQTLKANHKDVSIYEGDIKDFLKHLKTSAGKTLLGKIDHVHVSPPCQGFSGANRYGGANDLANNELSMTFVDLVRITKCTTAVFENVLGMWRRKHFHYIKNIFKELLKLGYQARCVSLKACDYGDPQIRPRFFIFVSHKSAPLPLIPRKTHGTESDLLPFVTVSDALSNVQNSNETIFNLEGKTTTVRPGQHGVVRLDPHGLAPAIRGSSVPPFHYDEDRCINVREAASLQSFPFDYVFRGDLQSQYRQVGNAVPVELATAVAQCVRQVLVYKNYKDN